VSLSYLPVLAGDGIGPEVTEAALEWLRTQGFTLPFRRLPFGRDCWLDCGEALPRTTEDALRSQGVALLGAAHTPDEGCRSPILQLRERLGLNRMIRPMPGGGPTLVIHSFAGLYAEHEEAGPPAVSRWVLHPHQADELAREAFGRATRRVTFVDKPTVRRHAAAMLREAANRHADCDWELLNADAFVAKLVADPHAFEVVAATSFVGDVLSDLFAALGTGLPTAASISLGEDIAVFEPVHGTAPHRVGSANPAGAIEAARLLLDYVSSPSR
jgi:isocitrate/isopropylmalate dehydrogenase